VEAAGIVASAAAIRTVQGERHFAGRALAYTGSASIIDRHIAPFFSAFPSGKPCNWRNGWSR